MADRKYGRVKNIRLTPDDWARLEAWMSAQPVPPTANAVIRTALSEWLERQGYSSDDS